MNKKLKYLSLSALAVAVLGGCSAGDCNTDNDGPISLAIQAPSQYPAGLPEDMPVTITMTNTSANNATNLKYTIPAPNTTGNTTGVVITPDAGIGSASGACTNIAAGASCTFTAIVGYVSHPGAFTVTATPDSSKSGNKANNSKSTQGKSLQADSISVTANLGLVDVPNTQNDFYILPGSQIIAASTGSGTEVSLSVLIKKAVSGLSSIKLVDGLTGQVIGFATLTSQNPTYTANSVLTYKLVVPAGVDIQHIQAYGYDSSDAPICNTLNVGTNNYNACSNDAQVQLANKANGILSIQPNYFNMSESYTSQVLTLTNIGDGTVSKLTYPTLPSQFAIANDGCAGKTLTAGQSCQLTINYTADSTSGTITPVFSYDDDDNSATPNKNTNITIPYTGTTPAMPYSVLTLNPASVSLTESVIRQVITITNIPGGSTVGATIPAGWTFPTLPAGVALESTNCAIPLGTPAIALAVGASCTYTIKYNNPTTAGQASLPFTYNNGTGNGLTQTSNLAVDWTAGGSGQVGVLTADPTSVDLNSTNLSKTITLTATVSPITLSSLPSNLKYIESATTCNTTTQMNVGDTCTYTVSYIESTVASNTESLVFGYATSSTLTVPVTVTPNKVNYAYVGIQPQGGASTAAKSVFKCTATIDGLITNCTEQAAYTALGYSSKNAYSAVFQEVNGTLFAYIPASDKGVVKCTLDAQGSFVACNEVGVDSFLNGAITSIAFNEVNSQLYAYSVDEDPAEVIVCPVKSDGDFDTANCITQSDYNGDSSLCPATDTSCEYELYQIAIQSINGVNYAFLGNGYDDNLLMFPFTSSGTLDPDNMTTVLSTSNDVVAVAFQTLSNNDVIGYTASKSSFYSSVNSTTGVFGIQNATADGLNQAYVYSYGFTNFGNTVYAYPATRVPSSTGQWTCVRNDTTGALESCVLSTFANGFVAQINGVTWHVFNQ